MTQFEEERRKFLGGTDIAAIMGLYPEGWNKNASTVYADKMGLSKPVEPTILMRKGLHDEPFVAELYADRFPEITLKEVPMIVHPDHPFIGGHPDRYVYNGKLQKGLEIKTADFRTMDRWGDDMSDIVPDYYYVQVQTYMAIDKLPLYDIYCLFGRDDARNYPIPRNDVFCDKIIEIGAEFKRKYLDTETPPPPDGSMGAADLLRTIYPHDQAGVMVATEEHTHMAEQYLLKKSLAKKAKTDEEAAKQLLMNVMENHSELVGETFKATWKKTKDGEKTDHKAICAELDVSAELLAKHTTTKEGHRRFLCNLVK